MKAGQTFEQSLRSREFEPDAPNYTPRISGILQVSEGKFHYGMSILKSNNGDPAGCNRFYFDYMEPGPGQDALPLANHWLSKQPLIDLAPWPAHLLFSSSASVRPRRAYLFLFRILVSCSPVAMSM